MNCLVTGGAGYIGSILCEHLLDAGHNVTVLDNLMYGHAALMHLAADRRFRFVRGDVRDTAVLREQLKTADVIIPLAALVGAPACQRDPFTAVSVNLESILELLKLRSPNQRLIYPNTNSGYGAQSGEQYCTEETPLEPISLYGRTKVDAEKAVLDSGESITLRLATVFGLSPRMRLDLLVNHFTYAAVTDGYLVVFEKDFKRNYVHISDVADCFLHCIDEFDRMSGRCYNLGLDDANLSKSELVTLIQTFVPRFYVHYAEVGEDPDKRNYIVSNARLLTAGFAARRGLSGGIEELLTGYSMMGRSEWANI